jgi:hypothetical protein
MPKFFYHVETQYFASRGEYISETQSIASLRGGNIKNTLCRNAILCVSGDYVLKMQVYCVSIGNRFQRRKVLRLYGESQGRYMSQWIFRIFV